MDQRESTMENPWSRFKR